MGARLCTRAELQADCTAGTGCGHDGDLVWSSDSDLTIAVAEAKSVEAGEKGNAPAAVVPAVSFFVMLAVGAILVFAVSYTGKMMKTTAAMVNVQDIEVTGIDNVLQEHAQASTANDILPPAAVAVAKADVQV